MNFKILDDIEIMTHFQKFACNYLPDQNVISQIKKWTSSYLSRGSYKEKAHKLLLGSPFLFGLYYLVLLVLAVWMESTTGFLSQIFSPNFTVAKSLSP